MYVHTRQYSQVILYTLQYNVRMYIYVMHMLICT